MKSRSSFELTVAVWLTVLAVGFAGMELYARRVQDFDLWSVPLRNVHPYYFVLDRLKVYNRKFYEARRYFFQGWPIPLELFEADKPTPRYLFKPNLRMAEENSDLVPARPGQKVHWSSNSWGLRGAEFPIQKPAGVFRIVALGGSTTEGSQGDLETYPYFLEKELRQMIPGRRIEVINAGHHGQDNDDLVEILRRKVLPLKPDIVIFNEVSNNIHWQDFVRERLPCYLGSCWSEAYPWWYSGLHRRYGLFRFLTARFNWARRFNQAGDRPPPMHHVFDDASSKPGTIEFTKRLREITRETLDSGARLVLLTYVTIAHEGLTVRYEDNPGMFYDLYKKWHPYSPGEIERIYAHYNREVKKVAKEFGVPLIDMAREFPRDVKYFPFDIVHFSPEGNQIFAKILARHLVAVLPVPQGKLQK
jgi:lysophospholipase L1-like esterase